ncbi:tagaturonate reductase [Paenibacillus filicis]|uniref:Tagaturonate reductase n=1 Tax=Paenibacillus gyeongsangnamensis TaxID=3388067 RepID=A0ABT4QLV9_9BACL|nr:tagaturonate reductase [Paenibacillus filicis]MCZ8517835.1 tagaturonate reductase [Paenibacillus filicis]
MKGIKKSPPRHPERVLQFGEGNFLRGFFNWMLHQMNQKELFNGQAVVIQPISSGMTDMINEQNGMYTLLLRGIQNGNRVEEAELITSIRRGINPYTDYKSFLHCASNPDLRFIVSNTTEAGIAYEPNDQYHHAPPSSFPGKLTVFLHKRFIAFHGDLSKGFIILPCELIDRNGDQLKQIVLRYARQWQLGEDFEEWLEHNHFLNTLVDRIVTGYPKEEIGKLTARLGYVDHLFNTAEPFHLWVIEGDRRLSGELPLVDAGLNVIWTNDLTPYRTRKVRLLNGAHTIALKLHEPGEIILKYGFPIGRASHRIEPGEWVHTHNLRTNLNGVIEYQYNPQAAIVTQKEDSADIFCPQFLGYIRDNGEVGIRNEIWIINTVGCVNKTAERLAADANKLYPNLTDGIFSFSHPYGCSQLGDDQLYTQRILAGLVRHPNAAGVLVLGLGCENNHIGEFQKIIGPIDENRVKFLSIQETKDELECGLQLIGELVNYAQSFKREPCPVSKLLVGLKCGGSDAFSGITANPLLGHCSDLLVGYGGSTVLTEVPEMFGAETILMNRCSDESIFSDTVHLINGFKEYYTRHNQVIYENPSPGNKKGGITTLEEKSLGCTQKGGTSPVMAVIPYGGQVQATGLQLLEGPGNDMVAVTALTAAGAHLILFTTGRGTPLGAPVPTVKVSSNSELSERKRNWIDFNAGVLLENRNLSELAETLLEYVLKVASGETRCCNERSGSREIAIFKDGVTL